MIQMKGIYKSFGSNDVLKDVNLTLNNGEVLALLGENGAGKSTLMNILGGVLPSDKGEIFLNDEKIVFNAPKDSLDSGIAFIHQELNLINDLTVYENLFLGNEIMKNSFQPDQEEMIIKSKELFEQFNVNINPKAMVSSLDASYKQIVEIMRALLMNAKYIIMDEPTTSLTSVEIENVFEMMGKLRDHGVGIIFISHKLDEVMTFCDRYMVLRNGVVVADDIVSNTTPRKIAYEMVGHDVRDETLNRDMKYGETVLKIENLTQEPHFRNINFEVKQGEILGITGLLGDGRSELFLTIFGDMPHYSGKIFVNNKEIQIKNINDAINHGIAYIPSNRKENGIIRDLNILENGTIVSLKKYAQNLTVINKDLQIKDFDTMKERLNLKMGKPGDLISTLSGGNQQKVVLTKWLLEAPRIFILDNPTQGVDVGSKEEIYDIIHDLAQHDVAIILLSNEAQEIIRTCDKAIVMYHGEIMGTLEHEEMTQQEIMHLATGGQDE
jgi:ribose transport system ATP-binding protein